MAATFQVYPIAAGASPNSIIVGPDRKLWFAIGYNGGLGPGGSKVPVQDAAIGAFDPSTGAVAEYLTPKATSTPNSIVSGPGGDLWFLDFTETANIASIDPTTHAITEYPIAVPGALPGGLAVGPDGNLWFTDSSNAAIGVFSTATHTVAEFPLPNTSDEPRAITAGPGGNLWFGLFNLDASSFAVGDISPTTHAITITTLPSPQHDPVSFTSGPNGDVWFNEQGGDAMHGYFFQVASINPTTRVIREYPGGNSGGITTGPDGNLWSDGTTVLSVFSPATLVAATSTLPSGVEVDERRGSTIVTGPDGNLWVAATGYLVSVHIVPADQAAVSGYVYLDATGAGPLNQGVVNSPLDVQTVFLDLKGDGSLEPGDPTATTDSLGYYAFTGLAPGTYTVRVVPYAGTVATFPAGGARTVTVTGGQLGSPGPLGILPTSSLLPLSYNPTPFGTANPDVQTAEVSGLYRLILGRAPDASGGAAAVAYLKGGGSVRQLAANLLASVEYDTDVVASDYRAYLRRAPDAAGGAAAVAYLQAGGSLDGLAESLMDSAEYSTLFAANTTFTQAIYGDILGRLASPSEIAAGAALLGTGYGRSSYVAFLVNSPESSTRAVVGEYGIIFARAADEAGQTSAVAAIQGGATPVGLAASLFGSDEFASRANATVR